MAVETHVTEKREYFGPKRQRRPIGTPFNDLVGAISIDLQLPYTAFKYALASLMGSPTTTEALLTQVTPQVAESLYASLDDLKKEGLVEEKDGENQLTPKGKYAVLAFRLLTEGGVLSKDAFYIGDAAVGERLFHDYPAQRMSAAISITTVDNTRYIYVREPNILLDEEQHGKVKDPLIGDLVQALRALHENIVNNNKTPKKIC